MHKEQKKRGRGYSCGLGSIFRGEFGEGSRRNTREGFFGVPSFIACVILASIVFALPATDAPAQPRLTSVNVTPSTPIASGSGIVVVKWTNSTPPFQVQSSTNLSVWQDVDATTSGFLLTNILTQPRAF